MSNNLATIFNSQASLFSSNNESIKLRAEELISKIIDSSKASKVVKPMCNTISTANNRAKIMLLDKLNVILPTVAEEDPV